jgi:hypothetical protein
MKGDFAMAENYESIHHVRIGRTKAAVFDDGEDAPRKVQSTALYKDVGTGKGFARSTREDLPRLAKVADQVHTYLYAQYGSSAG